MEYIVEIWKRLSDRYIQQMNDSIGGLARGLGFKKKKGEPTVPWSVVEELVADAYRQGAQAALKMAAELDGE
jgi:hypothetical protein